MARIESYRTEFVTERPDKTERGVLYAVGSHPARPEFLVFFCPCGEHIMDIPTVHRGCREPRWAVHFGPDGEATISPSLANKGCCTAHFFIRFGRVLWC